VNGSGNFARLPDELPARNGAILRAATVDQAEELRALYRELHPDDAQLTSDDIARELTSIQSDSRRVYALLDRDSTLIGTIDVFIMRNLTRRARPWIGVENLVVAARRRRAGHGEAMLEAVVSFADSIGAYKVQLISATGRTDAHRLYERCGFRVAGHGFRRYRPDPSV
jgi:GNAT superfamily N-acetyltransferase